MIENKYLKNVFKKNTFSYRSEENKKLDNQVKYPFSSFHYLSICSKHFFSGLFLYKGHYNPPQRNKM